MRAISGVPAVGLSVVLVAAAPASAAGGSRAQPDKRSQYTVDRDAMGGWGAGRRRPPITAVGEAATPGRPRPGSGVRRPSVIRLGSALASSVLAAVLLAGCAGEGGTEASTVTGSPSRTSVEPSGPATSEPADPDPTDDGTVDDGSGGQGSDGQESDGQGSDGHGSGDPGSGDQGSSGQGSGGGTDGLPGWPIESTPVHGARLWAAYLTVGAPGDPALLQVLEEVQQLWPGAGLGELGCDQGAAEALGRDRTEHAVAVYFATQQHITEFRRRWDGPYVGAVQVTISCGD
jgi:hypothetical protein